MTTSNQLPVAAARSPWSTNVVAVIQGQNELALNLHARLRSAPGNVLFSPYSIQTALAMVRAGAKGETAAQLDRVLHLPAAQVPEAFKSIVSAVTSPTSVPEPTPERRDAKQPAYAIAVANAVFGQRGYPFVPGFRALLAAAYGAELRDVDFRLGPAARKEINGWVLSKTNDRIQDLVPEGLPTADTRMAIVNAIHFLAPWAEPFQEVATTDATFTNAGGEQVNVRMMHRADSFRYQDLALARVLAIPYRGYEAEMVIVLPKALDGLPEVERQLTLEMVRGFLGPRNEHARVVLGLPRFRFEARSDLSAHLQALGLHDAFDARKADFTGIANQPGAPLYIGAVLHKAFIAVDEQGTEAAAATTTMMELGAGPVRPAVIAFECDRPFLFFVRHVPTGALLFAGRLSMPEPVVPPR